MKTKKEVVAKTAPKKASTKVVAPKKAVKTAVKKTTQKSTGMPLVYASSKTSFWLSDGQILNSLVALRDALKSMDKAVYAHHVSKDKNDFAVWVEAVLGDVACAKALKAAKTPTAAKTVVIKHLKVYTF